MKLRRPWRHQVDAMNYCRREKHPALFMEMRLGKVLCTVRRIKMYHPLNVSTGLRVLIVAPSSALGGWQDELTLEGETDVALLTGVKKKRRELLGEYHKWNLINKEGFLAIPEIAYTATVNWDVVVIDESTFIKSVKAKVTKFFLNNFRDCPHRWILAGMPNPESPMEFWSQLAFLDGYAFGHKNFWNFRATCFMQTPFDFGWDPKPGISSMIHKTVGRRAFILHRKDVNMANKKVYEKRFFDLPSKIRKSYDKAEDAFILEKDGVEVDRATYAIEQYQWLRQLCGGYLDHNLVWNGKIKELISLLRGELANQSVIVWFNYNQELLESEKILSDQRIPCETLWGVMSLTERSVAKKKFQNGQVRILLIQQAVAQMGMDLSKADTAIYFSNPTGLLARMQTEDRIEHGTKSQPLLYIDFLVRDSVDVDLYEALKDKKFKSKMTIDRAKKYCAERKANR